MPRLRLAPLIALLVGIVALVAGCGSSGGESRSAPPPSDFPAAQGKTISEILHDPAIKPSKLVIAPASEDFEIGSNRFSFGVFTLGGEQVSSADVALYFAKDAKSKVTGPYPASVESLETKPAYRSQNGSGPGEATSVYVVPKVRFPQNGNYLGVAILKGEDGLEAARLTSPTEVGRFAGKIPAVGDRAPKITTLTAADVGGDLEKIDTRIPPDEMHKYDFAKILGKKPIVLLFATPALCQSRVCGPVTDVAQQVADQYEPDVAFIHQEIYVDNDPNKGIRHQLTEFGLESEPWTFLIGKDGLIKDRIEGAYGVSELEEAMKTIAPN